MLCSGNFSRDPIHLFGLHSDHKQCKDSGLCHLLPTPTGCYKLRSEKFSTSVHKTFESRDSMDLVVKLFLLGFVTWLLSFVDVEFLRGSWEDPCVSSPSPDPNSPSTHNSGNRQRYASSAAKSMIRSLFQEGSITLLNVLQTTKSPVAHHLQWQIKNFYPSKREHIRGWVTLIADFLYPATYQVGQYLCVIAALHVLWVSVDIRATDPLKTMFWYLRNRVSCFSQNELRSISRLASSSLK